MVYWILKVIFTPVMLIAFRVRAQGLKNVPLRGPVILASNHQSFIDSIFMSLVMPRRLTFVAKAEYFESWKTAWFFRAMGMIPIKREGGTASQRALIAAQEVLSGGGMLGIYPEGTRSPDGRLYKGHTGAARLALLCDAPVVPVAQFGTAEIQPIGAKFPKLFRPVKVVMGPPLRFDLVNYTTASVGRPDFRSFTNAVMAAIQRLSGQEMADAYARRDKGLFSAPGSEAEPIPVNAAD
jgi:1-acyl-sn-glycerol-3-phosphate acyltransferase